MPAAYYKTNFFIKFMYFDPDGAHVRPRYVKGTDVVLHANPKRGKKICLLRDPALCAKDGRDRTVGRDHLWQHCVTAVYIHT